MWDGRGSNAHGTLHKRVPQFPFVRFCVPPPMFRFAKCDYSRDAMAMGHSGERREQGVGDKEEAGARKVELQRNFEYVNRVSICNIMQVITTCTSVR